MIRRLIILLLIVGCAALKEATTYTTAAKFKLGMTEEEFMQMYPAWDNMSRADQQSARKLYGFPISHGDSTTGGALHTVAKKEEDQ